MNREVTQPGHGVCPECYQPVIILTDEDGRGIPMEHYEPSVHTHGTPDPLADMNESAALYSCGGAL